MKGLQMYLEMARAWHKGRKSVTRRLMKPQPFYYGDRKQFVEFPKSRYQPGEVVYIQEPYRAWFPLNDEDGQPTTGFWHVRYRSDNAVIVTDVGWDEGTDYSSPYDVELDKEPDEWLYPILMPEKFSRSKARIVSVRPEQVQEISAGDALDEGFNYWGSDGELHHLGGHPSYSLLEFQFSWDTLYPGSWERNDWVWVFGLEKVEETP